MPDNYLCCLLLAFGTDLLGPHKLIESFRVVPFLKGLTSGTNGLFHATEKGSPHSIDLVLAGGVIDEIVESMRIFFEVEEFLKNTMLEEFDSRRDLGIGSGGLLHRLKGEPAGGIHAHWPGSPKKRR